MDKQEVELRATVPLKSKLSLINKISELSKKVEKISKIIDVYYAPISAKSMDDIPMNDIGSFSLRIRISNNSVLNVKSITNFGDHNAWDEVESEIDSPIAINRILKVLGFSPFCRLVKTRTSYIIDNECRIEIDDIEKYGIVIEIEQIVNKDRVDEAKKKNQQIFEQLGIIKEYMVPRTATEEYMKKFAFKETLSDEMLFN